MPRRPSSRTPSRAQVQLGRDSVALLRAESGLRVGTLGLLETIGLNLGAEVELVSQFEVFRPSWTSTELISIALESHPRLNAFVASEGARRANLRQARGQYFPNVSLTGSWDGFTQEIQNGEFNVLAAEAGVSRSIDTCNTFNRISAGLTTPLAGFPTDCGALQLSNEGRQAILDANSVFPFNFTSQPFRATLSVSIPIFNGFSREREVSQAANALEDAEYSRRAGGITSPDGRDERLRRADDCIQRSAGRGAGIGRWPAEQLELSRQRYALGADNFLVLLDAQRTMADGERAYLDGLYAFHLELANLENAVGQPLRPEE